KRLVIVGLLVILTALLGFYGIPFYRSAATPVIIGDGDSIMANGIALYFLDQKLGGDLETVDIAVPGDRVGVEVLARGLHGVPHFKLPGTRQVIWLAGGTNDLARSDGDEQV